MQQNSAGRPSTVWLALATSPFEIAISFFFALYGFSSLLGGVEFLTPPSVVATSTVVFIVIWHAALALGGAATLFGRALELERLEASGLACIIFACGFYGVVLGGVAGIASVASITAFVCIAAGSAFRMYVIWKSLRGQEIAHKVLLQLREQSKGEDSE